MIAAPSSSTSGQQKKPTKPTKEDGPSSSRGRGEQKRSRPAATSRARVPPTAKPPPPPPAPTAPTAPPASTASAPVPTAPPAPTAATPAAPALPVKLVKRKLTQDVLAIARKINRLIPVKMLPEVNGGIFNLLSSLNE